MTYYRGWLQSPTGLFEDCYLNLLDMTHITHHLGRKIEVGDIVYAYYGLADDRKSNVFVIVYTYKHSQWYYIRKGYDKKEHFRDRAHLLNNMDDFCALISAVPATELRILEDVCEFPQSDSGSPPSPPPVYIVPNYLSKEGVYNASSTARTDTLSRGSISGPYLVSLPTGNNSADTET